MKARMLTFNQSHHFSSCPHDMWEKIKEESIRKEQEKRKEELRQKLIQKIPFRFRLKETFNHYEVGNKDQARIKSIAERYVLSFEERLKEGTCLLFLGKPGTGKTLLSLIMYQELLKNNYRVQYESSIEFISRLLDLKFKSSSHFEKEMDAISHVQFLIVDEVTESINKEGVTSGIEKQLLFRLINDRYEKKLCTLIISNRNQSELIKILGSPIVDRLSEKGVTLAFNWDSYRQK